MAKQYGNLGLIYLDRGELAVAEDMTQKALELCREIGMEPGIEKAEAQLARIIEAKEQAE